MPAAAKERRHPGHIHPLVGAQAHLVLQHPCLIHENGTVDPLDIAQMVHNSVQIPMFHLIEIHDLSIQTADNAGSVHKTDALQKHPAQHLALQIGSLVKSLQNQLGKIKPIADQIGPDLHGPWRCVRVLEHTRVMDDAYVNRHGQIGVQRLFVYQFVNQFRGGAGIRHYPEDIAGSLITDVMIYIDGFPGHVIELFRRLHHALRNAVQHEKNIIWIGVFALAVYFVTAFDTLINLPRPLQVHLYPGLRHLFL